MNRPAGVTVSAVFLILGSIFTALTGAMFVFLRSFVPPQTPEQPFMRPMMIFMGGVLACFALWGVATAIGLLRMRSWARICTLVIGALLVFFFGLSLVMVVFLMPMVMPSEEASRGASAVMGLMTVVYAVPIAIGAWWLVYFNLGAVRAAFLEGGAPETGPHRPLSIAVIAWHAIAFGICGFALLPMRWPVYIFGIVFTGWAAASFYIVFSIAELAIGVGLLKLKSWGHTAAVWFCILVMAHSVVFLFLPDKAARLAEVAQQIEPGVDTYYVITTPFFWLGVVFTWVTFGTALWYLFTRKKAFLEAAKAEQAKAADVTAAPAP